MPLAVDSIVRRAAVVGLVFLTFTVATERTGPLLHAEAADPGADTRSTLARAHRVHPRNSEISIRLAMEVENDGDPAGAESMLLEAARFNRQFLPAWSLANFYFRQHNADRFWQWARRAASLAPDDERPLIRLASRLESDASTITQRLGFQPRVLRAQLDELIAARRLRDAGAVGRLLAEHGTSEDRGRLEALAELLSSEKSAQKRGSLPVEEKPNR